MAAALEEQRKEIRENQEKLPEEEGQSWFLIDQRWFECWKVYVEGSDQNACTHPGPIDNSKLLEDPESQKLKANLIENEDYVVLHAEAWHKLVSWYGQLQGQQAIERKVIQLSNLMVEVYRLELALCQYSNMDELVTVSFSRADTVDKVQKEARRIFKVAPEEETRLWAHNEDGSYERLRNTQATLNSLCLCSGQAIVMETRSDDGTWPTARLHTTRNSPENHSCYYQGQPGVCGLSNLGNTCFMNSALQCLSSTPPLTEYFLSNAYLEELNLDNPLGMQGEIAEAYADIIKQMWSGRHYTVIPRVFKTRVGHFAPQFSGYQPHDSQELLAFLLDGLHEDLNRVRRKEYVELKDAAGRDDEVVAMEAWANHHRRNDSIIVDIFHGLFKSTLVCPECSKVSITFDPFCYLSVPLPVSTERVLEVFLVPMDPHSKPIQHRVVVPKAGKLWDLYIALSKLSGIAPDKLVAADVFNHRFYRLFQTDDLLSTILDRDDIFVFEVTNNMEDEQENDGVVLPVYFREKVGYRGYSTSTYMFGHPLLVSVPRAQLNWEALYEILLQRLSRYVSRPTSDDEQEEDENPEEQEDDDEQNMYQQQADGLAEGSEGANSGTATLVPKPNASPEHANTEVEPSALPVDGVTSPTPGEGCRETESNSEGAQPSLDKRPLKKHKARGSQRPIFTFQHVNANGVTERGTPDCSRININTQTYIALDWESDMKKLYYDELEAEKYVKDRSMGIMPKKATVSLKECIDLFTTKETLEEENPWYCPVCKEHQLATKKFDLWSLPEVLIIHLKRFSYTRLWKEKLDTLVEFPLRDLNLSEFLINPKARNSKYDLIAVSNHYGSLRDGHYTTIARNKDDGHWYYFDDSKVTFASAEHIVSSAAYVLFYQLQEKVQQRAPGGASRSPSGTSRDTDLSPPGAATAGESMELD